MSPNSQSTTRASRIASMMMQHQEQGRKVLRFNPILSRVAQERVIDMAVRGYFSHVNRSGCGPNILVLRAGYVLPDHYGKDINSNSIESIGGGYSTADEAWQGWMNSCGHRTHLLALDPFFAEQIEIGIGYAYSENSPLRHYWAVLTAP